MTTQQTIAAAPTLTRNEAVFQGYRRLTEPYGKGEQEELARVIADMQGIAHCLVKETGGLSVWRKGLKLSTD